MRRSVQASAIARVLKARRPRVMRAEAAGQHQQSAERSASTEVATMTLRQSAPPR